MDGTGKKGAFKQVDYLVKVLNVLQVMLEAFALITHQLRPAVEPLFMEDGNSAHGHKSTSELLCAIPFKAWYYPSTSSFYLS